MIFSSLNEASEDVQDVVDPVVDPDSADGIEAMAQEVEGHMTSAALENASYFENGEEAVKKFTESAEVQALYEARRYTKNTFVRLNKNDDLQRRANLAALVLARNNNDPLFKKLALNRVKERQLRTAIFHKYGNKAKIVAKKSQVVHIKNSRKLPALPKIQLY